MHIPKGSAFGNLKGDKVHTETIPLIYDNDATKEIDERNNGSHIVIIVGWNDDLGAWQIKNSWGKHWGSQGFGYIAYGSNKIGMGAHYQEVYTPNYSITAVYEKNDIDEIRIMGWQYDSFRKKYDELWTLGYRIHQIDVKVAKGQALYNVVWR